MLQDDLKEIVRLARMGTPTDNTIKIARIAESALSALPAPEPDPVVKLESIQVITPEPPEPLDLEAIRIKLQTDEKVELPHKPPELLGEGVQFYGDPSIPLEISMSNDDADEIGDGEIVFDPTQIDPDKMDPRDV